MQLALFDFDGTISTKDSFMFYLPHSVPRTKLILGIFYLLPFILAYVFKWIKSHTLKERAMTFFYQGQSKEKFIQNCKTFTRDNLEKIVKASARKTLDWHRSQGHRIVIVSANFEEYLLDWCQREGVELIASRLETDAEGKITGKILGNNCHGQEKVNRIMAYLNIKDYEKIYAYGNSEGDREMIAMAHEGFYRNFR